MSSTHRSRTTRRRAYTVRDLAVTAACLLVAGGLLVAVTGATRDLSQTQTCMGNLRQLYGGLMAYVNQYNAFPPNGPYPQWMPNESVNGWTTNGWDPSMGWILTYGLGYTPPATFPDGHFKWYGTAYADLPDVCKCPSMSPALLDPTNPEIDVLNPLETVVYQYALSYQMAGTCRSALPIRTPQVGVTSGIGGRCAAVPDPSGGTATAQPYNNAQRGVPFVWVYQHAPGAAPSDPQGSEEWPCSIQAVHPAEVQAPSRTYYFSDSRDYRPSPGQWPAAARYNGWDIGYGNQLFVGSRHFGSANVLYLDGQVSRDGQTHLPQWVLTPGDPNGGWRVASFQTSIRLANIRGQWPIMPVLRVRGWEYFFKAGGLTPR